ncbi:MAG: cobalamin biosynthesis protein CbiD [Clostridia bacterium]|nr:cobalamin biosynthesis protein CbiD [Clostridia bacterium]
MGKTGIEEHFIEKDGKRLRYGFTTGTCAAAAAKAAACLLLSGTAPQTIAIRTPKGIDLTLPVLEPVKTDGFSSCAIRKDSGDDPDVTNGVLVYARVAYSDEPGVSIDGGIGVGRVTKPGLKQAIGEAAINPVPREMIRQAVEAAAEKYGCLKGLSVVISIPEGVALAEKTFNPRLGIVGGISILGTSGVVEPMSEDALVDSIALEIRQRKALGDTRLILTPGNYGADFLKAVHAVADERVVKCSNFVGDALKHAEDTGFSEVLLVGHIGKFVKLSGGIMNTHSKYGDHRAELMAAAARAAGAEIATEQAMFDCVTTDEMLRILAENGLLSGTMDALKSRIDAALAKRFPKLKIGVIVFTTGNRELFQNALAGRWTEEGI